MLLHYTSTLVHLLLATFLHPAGRVRASPVHAVAISPEDGSQIAPHTNTSLDAHLGRRSNAMTIHGLPRGWIGIFKSVTSIQPHLPLSVFAHLFSIAAHAAATGRLSSGPYQRIAYGALFLEFIPVSPNNPVVTKEFVEAASLWLLDAAQKGFTEFFEAWIRDQADTEVVYVKLGTIWDSVFRQKSPLDDWLDLASLPT